MAIFDRFHYGVCYFPEHWEESLWESDIARMARCGFSMVRMAEGAWGYFEPEEGKFQFELFDRVIDICRKHEIQVIMGTPTYCGPAWIARNYPEVMRWDFHRRPMMHGGRRHFNYTSRKYLELSDRICTALAEHYKNEKQIIGWQIDNELNCHMDVSYSPSDTAAFRVWLQKKYKTLEALNKAWGTAFWSQQYDTWEQIDLPGPVVAYMNPTQLLDESRFISDTVVAFANRQKAILRKANPSWRLTHNAIFGSIDSPALGAVLDFFSHDQYPMFYNDGKEWTGYMQHLLRARSLSFPFAILEQQSGPGGQMEYLQRTPRPGQMRLWAWQTVAHGAKLVSYFRWRTCPYGAEQHWHGILDPDNKDNRRLAEVKQTGHEFFKLPKAFHEAPVPRAVAVMRDFENETNAGKINTYAREGSADYRGWCAEFARRHIPVDVVWRQSDLRGYRVVILPHFKMADKKLVARLTAWVKAGGTLVLTAQAGMKDENLHLVRETYPGIFRALAGVEIADWTTLAKDDVREAITLKGHRVPMTTFVERVAPRGAEILAHWGEIPGTGVGTGGTIDTLLHTSPAVTLNYVGKGQVIYVGGYCTPEARQVLAGELAERVELASICAASDRVEAVARGGTAGKPRWIVLLNHGPRPEPVRGLPANGSDLVSGKKVAKGSILLPPYGVAVIG